MTKPYLHYSYLALQFINWNNLTIFEYLQTDCAAYEIWVYLGLQNNGEVILQFPSLPP